MNLLEEPWIPVLRRDGSSDRVAPASLSQPDIVAFDAPRADFNGALAQFMIGLLQTATPVQSIIAWRKLLLTPPDTATLREWFTPHTAAFSLDGPGARFMQDFDLAHEKGDIVGIGGLLIDSPGESTVKKNRDLFVKRDRIQCMCLHCAATALFALQSNAPEGGRGQLTSVRGGGPLTTLLIAEAGADSSLWNSLWLNVCDQQTFQTYGGDPDLNGLFHLFPWVSSIRNLQRPGGQTTPAQTNPAHVFWATPRRVRLNMQDAVRGECDVCHRLVDQVLRDYRSRPNGLNYKGSWRHPLSPYYQAEKELLAVHPQGDGLGYQHWLAWVLGASDSKRTVERARPVDYFFRAGVEERSGIRLRVWAFGYDMASASARCWYDSTVPLYSLADSTLEAQKTLREDVGSWLDAADLVAFMLSEALVNAWFSTGMLSSRRVDELRRQMRRLVNATFWSRTEADFYRLLQRRIEGQAIADRTVNAQLWLDTLTATAMKLFDGDWVGSGPVERMNPARVADAHRKLRASLHGPKLRTALALEVEAKPAKVAKKAASKKSPKP